MSELRTSQVQHITNKARNDKFLLVFSIPPALHENNTQILSVRGQDFVQEGTVQFSIWGTVVPSVSIPAHDARFNGQSYKVTSQSRNPYNPIMVNFHIDNNYNNYYLLWKWLDVMNKTRDSGMDERFNYDKIHQAKGKLDGPKYTDYQTIMTVYGLDEYNKRVIRFDYHNAFITDLGEIRYSHRNDDEIESNFTFVFNQMDIKLMDDDMEIES